MHARQAILLLIVAAAWAWPALGEEAPTTAPADAASVQRCFAKFVTPWVMGEYAKCRSAFAKDADASKGSTSLEHAKKQAERIIDRRSIQRLHGGNRYETQDGRTVAVISSTWILRPLKDVRENKQLLVTEEQFTFVEVGGQMLVDQYTIADVTAATVAAAKTRIAKRKAILDDPTQRADVRMTRGLEMFEDLWAINQTDDLWPLLKQLVDLGIAKDEQARQLLAGLVRRAMRTDQPPKEYERTVNDFVKSASN